MKILFLGYDKDETRLIKFLKSRKHDVTNRSDKIKELKDFDLVISFGYRYIFNYYQLSKVKRPIVNLHISYLPFNRGSHPNFWAHFEETPSGVTIHEIDKGIDTGPIIFQKKVCFDNQKTTLEESHLFLKSKVEDLFMENVHLIESRKYKPFLPEEVGTFHNKCDLPTWVQWDMSIGDVKNRC